MPSDFLRMSRLLTGSSGLDSELDSGLAPRVWQALMAKDADFPTHYWQLSDALSARSVTSWADYVATGLREQVAIHAIAVALVGAWYLGRVGPMLPRSETGTPAFITYEGALMWRSTRDVTVIPSYARGGPGFWAEAPLSLATD
ncbi:sugar dehydrogenase complex small subunit [Asaia platycodi]|uniref:sugar dehydrogenase complex small subunit n=1 Tax=Asaia platycodi TaxID=610243 RepID=UPI002412C0C4|nr:sugar dehydrogenase complex small subunit [Asaia platycodi]